MGSYEAPSTVTPTQPRHEHSRAKRVLAGVTLAGALLTSCATAVEGEARSVPGLAVVHEQPLPPVHPIPERPLSDPNIAAVCSISAEPVAAELKTTPDKLSGCIDTPDSGEQTANNLITYGKWTDKISGNTIEAGVMPDWIPDVGAKNSAYYKYVALGATTFDIAPRQGQFDAAMRRGDEEVGAVALVNGYDVFVHFHSTSPIPDSSVSGLLTQVVSDTFKPVV